LSSLKNAALLRKQRRFLISYWALRLALAGLKIPITHRLDGAETGVQAVNITRRKSAQSQTRRGELWPGYMPTADAEWSFVGLGDFAGACVASGAQAMAG
jgi:hypothetical protein